MMKRYVLPCLAASIALMAFVSYKPGAPKHFQVDGTIKGIKTGKVKLVVQNDERVSTTIDSGVIVDGKFKLDGRIASAQMVAIVFEPGNFASSIFLEGNPVTVTVDTAGSKYYDYTKQGFGKGASLTKLTETGSKNYYDLQRYNNDPGQKQFDPAFAELNKQFQATQKAKDVDAEYRVRDKMDSVQKLKQAWQKKKIDEYVAANPSSVAGVYMFYDLYRFVSGTMPYNTLNEMMNKFTGDAKASPYYDSLAKSRARLARVQVGQVAPDFTLLKRDSTKLSLSSLRGNYVMIDFWASWCHPCRQAIPHWKEVYSKYHDKGFNILSVSDDSNWSAWKKAMDVEKMPWPQVDDRFSRKNMPADVGSLYMTTFIPFYVLLDKEGKILVYSGDEARIDDKLKEIYGK